MIDRVVVDGRNATVVYMKHDYTPVDTPRDAEVVKILFDDGTVRIAFREKEPE